MKTITITYDPLDCGLPDIDGEPADLFSYLENELNAHKIKCRIYDRGPRIVVGLDGGLVQGISTDIEGVSAIIVDYDIEGADLSEIHDVPQSDGDTAEAYIRGEVIDDDPDWVAAMFDFLDKLPE